MFLLLFCRPAESDAHSRPARSRQAPQSRLFPSGLPCGTERGFSASCPAPTGSPTGAANFQTAPFLPQKSHHSLSERKFHCKNPGSDTDPPHHPRGRESALHSCCSSQSPETAISILHILQSECPSAMRRAADNPGSASTGPFRPVCR